MAEQPTHIEAAVTTAVGAVQGAALGGLMGTLTADGGSPFPAPQPPPNADPAAMASFKQAQALAGGPLVQARNFAVMTGANAGISCIMRRIRGGEDIQGSMAAAFGSGALFSIVSGMGTPNPVANAITTGAAFAIFQGGFFMTEHSESKYSNRTKESIQDQSTLPDTWCSILMFLSGLLSAPSVHHRRGRPSVLPAPLTTASRQCRCLGGQRWRGRPAPSKVGCSGGRWGVRCRRKGLLTDQTLPLLTDSALRYVKIPPGPRLLILYQIKRDPEFAKAR